MSDHLTVDDLAFLARPLFGVLTTAAGPQPPQARPVWFEATADGAAVQLFTGPNTLKARRLARDPRAALLVASPVGEPERWVSVSGPATVEPMEPAEGRELVGRLGARYYDLDDPALAEQLEAMLAQEWVRVVVLAETVRRFAN